MPKNPAMVEKIAPIRKQTAVIQFPMPTPMTTNSTAANMTRTLYSEKRNALAPSRIAPDISFIRSVPSSSLRTEPARYNAKSRASTAHSGTNTGTKLIMVIPPSTTTLYVCTASPHSADSVLFPKDLIYYIILCSHTNLKFLGKNVQ